MEHAENAEGNDATEGAENTTTATETTRRATKNAGTAAQKAEEEEKKKEVEADKGRQCKTVNQRMTEGQSMQHRMLEERRVLQKEKCGHYLSKVCSSKEGIAWLHEYDRKSGSFQTTPSQVETFTPQGVCILQDSVVECEREVADPKHYFTIPKDFAEEVFHVEDPKPIVII